ncbi:hypothetical protein B0T18DRAFT_87917 [Schizothecium vesticola]|uniref:Uncharacterized protein n=1 Tax=Schizothecium vesticola TaxID=314040 RepID=A0AA40KB18_9PEZI|nr:hypothetical protein B0T18DRAFT_87917 [Schizothecium vesticola]
MCLPTIQHRYTAAAPCGLVDAEYATIGADCWYRYCPAHRTVPARHGLAGRDKVSSLAPEALYSRRTLCNYPPSGPGVLDRDPRHAQVPCQVGLAYRASVWSIIVSQTAILASHGVCGCGGAWAHGSWGLRPVPFPITHKGRKDGRWPAACWSRQLDSPRQSVEHPARARAHHHSSYPVPDKSPRRSWADLGPGVCPSSAVHQSIHGEWIVIVQQVN